MTEKLSTAQREKTIEDNLRFIEERISEAAEKSGRTRSDIRLMAVTKTVDPVLINAAVDAGVTVLGENRVQEFLSKREQYRKEAEVQFIGHLQTNKVKQIIDKVTLIHSVDSLHLAEAVDRAAANAGITMPVLLEVNIGGEESKSGADPAEVEALLKAVQQLSHVQVRGLMTIPPPTTDADTQNAVFAKMAALYRNMQTLAPLDVLSMGMSGDYQAAIRHGSTMVRIGSALFGARYYPPKL